MIPKIIHYVWIGDNVPETVQKCIDSWKEKCPDFEIKCWNETNLPMDNTWIKSCYEIGGWALGFLVDYVKAWAIHKYGGIWVDADLEITAPIDDLLVHKNFIFSHVSGTKISTCFLGGEKGSKLFKSIADVYENRELPTVKDRRIMNSIYAYNRCIAQYGIKILPCAKESGYIYGDELAVFYTNYIDEHWQYALHHGMASWLR